MTSKLKNIHPTLLVMLRLVEKDTSFKLVAYLAPDIQPFLFSNLGVVGHFE
jgi:hypothetical protein